MNAFRGEAWMSPTCRGCEHREEDFGGCRCQAFQLTGDASATDPACPKSPHHGLVLAARERAAQERTVSYSQLPAAIYRTFPREGLP
jgi:pyrroloquinoline quinone biosynthesis protein E